LNKEGRKVVGDILREEWIYDYLEGVMTHELSLLMADPTMSERRAWRRVAAGLARLENEDAVRYNCRLMAAAFPRQFKEPLEWGGGVSLRMLRDLKAAGLDRFNLCLGGLGLADHKPHVAAAAEAMGYLLGPYDCYESVHRPGAPEDETWDTAQF